MDSTLLNHLFAYSSEYMSGKRFLSITPFTSNKFYLNPNLILILNITNRFED